MKNILRSIYNRTLRGTTFGSALRNLYFGNDRYSISGVRHFLYRANYVRKYFWIRIKPAFRWLLISREDSNFSYDLTRRNKEYIAELLAVVFNERPEIFSTYIEELERDDALRTAAAEQIGKLGPHAGVDATGHFGRRSAWYAIVRHMKPKVLVETGVDKGLGALLLCAALLRNQQEGFPGRYFGTDIDPGAGILLCQPYSSVGAVLYGDSIESLIALEGPIDVFINDSDHSAEYEGREYRTVIAKLADHAVIVGDNSHVTQELQLFSRESGRKFLAFREEPADHWYLGAGFGISFR